MDWVGVGHNAGVNAVAGDVGAAAGGYVVGKISQPLGAGATIPLALRGGDWKSYSSALIAGQQRAMMAGSVTAGLGPAGAGNVVNYQIVRETRRR